MYHIQISMKADDKFGDIFLEDIEATEITIESLVGSVLLEVYGTVTVENVSVGYDSSGIDIVIPEDTSLIAYQSKSIQDIERRIEANLKNKVLAEPFSTKRVNSVVLEREEPNRSSVVDKALTIARDRSEAIERETQATAESDISFDIRLQFNEEPLTAHNLNSIISAFTELHTKCWLIAHGRFADLIEYTQTHNERFAKEANLVIVKITHNSPADFKFNVNADASAQGLAEALQIGVDTFLLAPHRRKAAELEDQATELAIKQKELEAQAIQSEKEQNLQIATQQAEINRQKGLLELQQQQLQVAKQQIELDRERLELEKNRLKFALETAGKMVDILHPGIDEQTKAMLLQTLIPNLLQAANGQGVVIALPEPKKEETK